ncbi:MAG: T9SS type A sorting domain-containing protein [Saprospiraceae bacterium]|nr:T9SS type A sorting domain-containing protein [Saprospiraceae bacterium]
MSPIVHGLIIISFVFSMNTYSLKGQTPVFEYVKAMGGPSTDIGSSVSLDAKGNLYTAGSFEETVDFDAGPLSYLLKSNGARDIFITKMDSKGELIWAKNIGGDKSDDGRYMSTDLSGNIYITGTFQGTVDFDPGPGLFPLTSQNKDDLFILKLNADGNFLWAYQFNASTYIDINALVLDAQNNVYLTGYFNERIDFDFGSSEYYLSPFGQEDIFILKMNASGQFLWARQLGGKSFELVNDLTIDIEGNVITTGQFTGTTDFDPGPDTFQLTTNGIADIFISKINPSGNFVWAKSIGGLAEESGRTLVTDPMGNIYLAGEFHGPVDFDPGSGTRILTPKGSKDLFLLKLTDEGNYIWAQQIGNSTARSSDVTLDKKNDLYLTGIIEGITDLDPGTGIYELGAPNTFSIFTLKLDKNGIFNWAYSIEANLSDVGFQILVDPTLNVYLMSSFTGYVDFDPGSGVENISTNGFYDIFLHKMSQQTTANHDIHLYRTINCYPNPVAHDLEVRFESKDAHIDLYNALGAHVYSYSEEKTGVHRIDMTKFSNGIYFLKLTEDQKSLGMVKIAKY